MWRNAALAGLIVLIASGTLVWYQYHNRSVSEEISSGIQQAVRRNPRLGSLYDEALSDGVLSMSEANQILDEADATSTGND